MTREQLQEHIAFFTAIVQMHFPEPSDARSIYEQTIARLRADLARLDGPAEGFVRLRIPMLLRSADRWIVFEMDPYHAANADSILRLHSSRSGATYGAPRMIVVDVPIPETVECEGQVEP